MKTLNKSILTILILSLSLFVACSDDKSAVPPSACVGCPTGLSHSLGKTAIGKNYADSQAGSPERFQLALNFFGIGGHAWGNYPLNSEIAADGFFYANQPLTCMGIYQIAPQGTVLAVQTEQAGTLTSYYTIHGLVLRLPQTNVRIVLDNAAISPISTGASVIDVQGRQHYLAINDYYAEIYVGTQYCGVFGLRGEP